MEKYPLPIMKEKLCAFLLAAGEGTRLRPLTYKTPKCLIPIQGMSMLEFWLEKCGLHGIKDIFINTYHLSKKVEQFLKEKKLDQNITIIRERELKGTAGTIADSQKKLRSYNNFFVIYIDMLTNLSLYDLYKHHKSKGVLATLVVKETKKREAAGIVKINKHSVVMDFQEKPKRPRSKWANQGIYILNKKIFQYFSEKRPLDFGYDVFPQLSGKLSAFKTKEITLDIGSKEGYKKAKQEWNNISLI